MSDTYHTIEVPLGFGLKIKDKKHMVVVLREGTPRDMLAATRESERLFQTEEGPELVASPTEVGLHTLRRQVVNVDDYEGPLTLAELLSLKSHDLALLQSKSLELEKASLAVMRKRGRRDGAAADADDIDVDGGAGE